MSFVFGPNRDSGSVRRQTLYVRLVYNPISYRLYQLILSWYPPF